MLDPTTSRIIVLVNGRVEHARPLPESVDTPVGLSILRPYPESVDTPVGLSILHPYGLAAVAMAKRFGYIDKNGKFAINPQFDLAGDFDRGLAPVWVGGRQGYIDKQGKFVWNPTA